MIKQMSCAGGATIQCIPDSLIGPIWAAQMGHASGLID
jgi:hypothetical protein